MVEDSRIESYLARLDRWLRDLPVGQRAEIVTAVKAEILTALDKSRSKDVDSVLNHLGMPKAVAERYLGAKGLRSRRSSGKWFKWLAVGTVALFALILILGIKLFWRMTPLGQWGAFQLSQMRIGNMQADQVIGQEDTFLEGREDIVANSVRLLRVPFNTARLTILQTTDQVIHWNCRSRGGEFKPTVEAGVLNFNLDSLNLARCQISIPQGLITEFNGINGEMEIKNPSENMKITLINGKVNIQLDPEQTYDVDVKVKNGLKDFFPRSSKKTAVKLKVNVVNGLVKKD
jgi:hypothetical protein